MCVEVSLARNEISLLESGGLRETNTNSKLEYSHQNNFIFPTLETRRDSSNDYSVQEGGRRPQSFTQAAPIELKLGKGG